MASRLHFSIDPTKSISRLLGLGLSFIYCVQWIGKSTLLQHLEKFSGGNQREEVLFDSWLLENRKTMVNNFPSFPTLKIDFGNANVCDNEVDEPGISCEKKLKWLRKCTNQKKAALLIDNFDLHI